MKNIFKVSVIFLFFNFSLEREPDDNEIDKRRLLEEITRVGRKKFLIVKKKMRFADAMDFCHSLNFEVLAIETQTENDVLYEFLAKSDYGFVWLGITDLFNEGKWRWIKTGFPLKYNNWENKIEVEENKTKNCAYLQKDGFWIPSSCSLDKNFPICMHVRKAW